MVVLACGKACALRGRMLTDYQHPCRRSEKTHLFPPAFSNRPPAGLKRKTSRDSWLSKSSYYCLIRIGANEKSMIGVFIVTVKDLKTDVLMLLALRIKFLIICIPLSIIRSLSFAVFPNGPTSGSAEKGMTALALIISAISIHVNKKINQKDGDTRNLSFGSKNHIPRSWKVRSCSSRIYELLQNRKRL